MDFARSFESNAMAHEQERSGSRGEHFTTCCAIRFTSVKFDTRARDILDSIRRSSHALCGIRLRNSFNCIRFGPLESRAVR